MSGRMEVDAMLGVLDIALDMRTGSRVTMHFTRARQLRESVESMAAELAAARRELAHLKADCRSVYDAIPGLPIEQTYESCEAATEALHAFCLLMGVHNIDIGPPAALPGCQPCGDTGQAEKYDGGPWMDCTCQKYEGRDCRRCFKPPYPDQQDGQP